MKKLNPGLTDQQVYQLFGGKPTLKVRAFKRSDGTMDVKRWAPHG